MKILKLIFISKMILNINNAWRTRGQERILPHTPWHDFNHFVRNHESLQYSYASSNDKNLLMDISLQKMKIVITERMNGLRNV